MRRLLGASVLAFFASVCLTVYPAAQVVHIPSLVNFINRTMDIQYNGIGTTSTSALTIRNLTSAADGAQQYSPRLCFQGAGWKTVATAASQTTVFCVEDRPVQGTSNPTHGLVLSSSVNGGAFVDLFAFSDAGSTITLANQGSLQIGGNVLVQSGQLNIGSAVPIRSNGNGTRITMPADGEISTSDNATTNSAGIRQKVIVEVDTTSKTPTALESNEYYTNTGDGDGATFTLLNDPPIGITYTFMVTAAQTITITAGAGETLKFGTSTCGTSLTSNAVGSSATFVASTGGAGAIWITVSTTGTWTCNA